MARRARNTAVSGVEDHSIDGSTPQARIETWAEDLGRVLGTARARADTWLNQRQEIVRHLTGIRDTASNLLTQLGQQSQRAIKGGRAAYRAAVATDTPAAGGKKRRRMSKAARAKIAAAQRARWARQKAAAKK
jgi:hypothetical protein